MVRAGPVLGGCSAAGDGVASNVYVTAAGRGCENEQTASRQQGCAGVCGTIVPAAAGQAPLPMPAAACAGGRAAGAMPRYRSVVGRPLVVQRRARARSAASPRRLARAGFRAGSGPALCGPRGQARCVPRGTTESGRAALRLRRRIGASPAPAWREEAQRTPPAARHQLSPGSTSEPHLHPGARRSSASPGRILSRLQSAEPPPAVKGRAVDPSKGLGYR